MYIHIYTHSDSVTYNIHMYIHTYIVITYTKYMHIHKVYAHTHT